MVTALFDIYLWKRGENLDMILYDFSNPDPKASMLWP
jgi:hypothetical protein